MSMPPPPVSPEKTWALLVGVEQYESPELPRLKGPAQDALGHAKWLRDRGVPPAQIRLCLSPHDDPGIQEAAADLGLGVLPATRATVHGILRDQLPHWHGDMLWLAWSGHGVLDPGTREQLLAFSDGAEYFEQTLAADRLQDTLLHHPPYQNIPLKILFIDACRVPDWMGEQFEVVRLPATRQGQPASQVSVLYATQKGQTAGGGKFGFTRALLEELPTTAPTWPPDVEALAVRIRERQAGTHLGQAADLYIRNWNGFHTTYAADRRRDRPTWLYTHDEAVEKVASPYLRGDKLPYVAPREARHRPENLLTALEDPGTPLSGLLLTGFAGAGKTRTCLEVAGLAHRNGWHVLHIAEDGGLSEQTLLDEIQEELRRHPDTRLLLVLDYLDRYDSLGLKQLATSLRAEARGGARIACLAAVRPGALEAVRDRDSQELFEEIELPQDDAHQRAVSRMIFQSVAQDALDAWDFDKMADLCTTRPGFAVLNAVEVEKRFKAREFTGPPPSTPRHRNLVKWLRRRTREDLDPNGPDRTLLLASTVTALSCPRSRTAVEAVVDRHLTIHAPDSGDRGTDIVADLEALGWLLPAADGTDTVRLVHDGVTDAFLDHSCRRQSGALDSRALHALLDPLLEDIRCYRRAVGHLSRWAADLDPHDKAGQRLPAECAAWLRDHQDAVLTTLLASPGHGMRALVSMISAAPWRQGVIDTWAGIAGPWTQRTTDAKLVRLFLTDAIRNLPGRLPGVLLDAARDWLDRHTATDPDALALITTLIRSDGLSHQDDEHRGHRRHLEDLSLTWLDQHGDTSEARHRILALLHPGEHTPAVLQRATRTAVALAHRLRRERDTERLLTTLLRSPHVPDDDQPRLTEAARAWLRKYGKREEATYILTAALDQPRTPDPDAQRIADAALTWLGVHRRKSTAGFVLPAVLSREGLPDRTVRRAVADAHAWLTTHPTEAAASFVLAPLLHDDRVKAAPDSTHTTVTAALRWLEKNGDSHQACYVLSNLLQLHHATTPELDEAAVRDKAITTALAWLKIHPDWNYRLLGSLLAQGPWMTQAQKTAAATEAVIRLEYAPRTELDDSYVHRELLEMTNLPPQLQQLAFDHAAAWLRIHGGHPTASFVIAPFLFRASARAAPAETGLAVEQALRWLQEHDTTKQADYVLRNLLTCRNTTAGDLDAQTVAQLAFDHALAWLNTHGIGPIQGIRHTGTLVLGHLIDRRDELTAHQAHALMTLVQARLDEQPRTAGTAAEENHLLQRLLKLPLPTPEAERRTIRWARDRIGPHPTGPDDDRVLGALLRRLKEADHPDPDVVRGALGWLAARPRTPDDRFTIGRLLELGHLPPAAHEAARGHARDWLEKYGTTPDAGLVLGVLLSHLQETGTSDPATVRAALDWLDLHGLRGPAKHVLRTLGAYDYAAPHRPETQAFAERWIEAHPDAIEDIQTHLAAFLPPR